MSIVQTVLGPINSELLGTTLTHEHIICDACLCKSNRDRKEELPWGSYMWFDEIPTMIDEISRFRANGGNSIVEVTCHGWGRDPLALKEISEKTGVHIVASTGFYVEDCMPPWVSKMSVDQLSDWVQKEILVGCTTKTDDKVTDIRAGIIKTSLSRPQFCGDELKCVKAVAKAHLKTGAPITSHSSGSIRFEIEGGNAGTQLLSLLEEEGVQPDALIVGHADENPNIDNLVMLAKRGAWIQFDTIGKQQYIPDEARADLVIELKDKGMLDHLLLSQDRNRKPELYRYGGPGYLDLMNRFVPILRNKGITDNDIRLILVDNPRKALAMRF
jgi:predicted metal-dependent phosphotriesterase family hydrolase